MSPIDVTHEHLQAVTSAIDHAGLRGDLDLLKVLPNLMADTKNIQEQYNESCIDMNFNTASM